MEKIEDFKIGEDDFGFETKKAENWHNKQRTILLSSKGTNQKERQLIKDFIQILPHCKTDSKLEKREIQEQIKSICQMNSATNYMYFENRGKKTFLYIGKYPEGPTIKYLIKNCVAGNDLRYTGNCLKSSRPILSFGSEFQNNIQKKLEKNLWVDILNVPNNHPKSQPFVDKIFAFNYVKGISYFRNYQIKQNGHKTTDVELIEIGPRMNLELIRVFSGVLGGETLYKNPNFVSATEERRLKNKKIDKIRKKKVKNLKVREKRMKNLEFSKDKLNSHEAFLDEFK